MSFRIVLYYSRLLSICFYLLLGMSESFGSIAILDFMCYGYGGMLYFCSSNGSPF